MFDNFQLILYNLGQFRTIYDNPQIVILFNMKAAVTKIVVPLLFEVMT